MKKGILLIYGDDAEYIRKLAGELLREESFPFTPVTAVGEAALGPILQGEEPALCLADRERVDELKRKTGAAIILMTETEGYTSIEGYPAVYKYQPAAAIRRQLLELLREETAAVSRRQVRSSAKVCYIGVMSPVGRCLKTGFCFAMGQLLAVDTKVLYVNLEAFSGFSALFDEPVEKSLSDALYCYETRGNMTETEPYVLHFHRLDILPPVRRAEDLYETAPEKVRDTVFMLAEAGGYSVVLLDLGTDYRLAEAFMPYFRKLYMPARKDTISGCKLAEFRNWLLGKVQDNDIFRVEEVILPMTGHFVFGKRYLEQLLFSELGDYVRNLMGGYY